MRLAGEADPDAAALAYEKVVSELVPARPDDPRHLPAFDLILLGMGGDGHTASLFPHTAALAETERLVVANVVPQLNTTRLTFTYPLINAARRVLFLVSGAGKADVLEGRAARSAQGGRIPQPRGCADEWHVDVVDFQRVGARAAATNMALSTAKFPSAASRAR